MWLKKRPKKVRVKCDFCGCEFNVKAGLWNMVRDSTRWVTPKEIDAYGSLGIELAYNTNVKYKYIMCPVCERIIRFDEEIQWKK